MVYITGENGLDNDGESCNNVTKVLQKYFGQFICLKG